MIYSSNTHPSIVEFQELIENCINFLNDDASRNEDYYLERNGKLLEDDVFDALNRCAMGTSFQNTIQKISGQKFPDIIANGFYGIEVKSSKKNNWTSTGSSILESTRVPGVERIFLIFGKLHKPVEFKARPYEECLSRIAVTHMPRYLIDMNLSPNDTIFKKMEIEYDVLRNLDDPIKPVSEYLQKQLKPGEKLWWATRDDNETVSSPILRLWSYFDAIQKNDYISKGFAFFPEVIRGDYNRYCMWLIQECGVVNPNIRDGFSAGGKISISLESGSRWNVIKESYPPVAEYPAVYGRLIKHKDQIAQILLSTPVFELENYWQKEIDNNDIIGEWCELMATESGQLIGYGLAWEALNIIFDGYLNV